MRFINILKFTIFCKKVSIFILISSLFIVLSACGNNSLYKTSSLQEFIQSHGGVVGLEGKLQGTNNLLPQSTESTPEFSQGLKSILEIIAGEKGAEGWTTTTAEGNAVISLVDENGNQETELTVSLDSCYLESNAEGCDFENGTNPIIDLVATGLGEDISTQSLQTQQNDASIDIATVNGTVFTEKGTTTSKKIILASAVKKDDSGKSTIVITFGRTDGDGDFTLKVLADSDLSYNFLAGNSVALDKTFSTAQSFNGVNLRPLLLD